MRISYFSDEQICKLVKEIVEDLSLDYVDLGRIVCVRSKGSKARYTVARCHGLPRIWQKALREKPTYIIEVISENFDRLSSDEKEKTLLHEVLHIPRGFSGGFRSHSRFVNRKTVDRVFADLQRIRALRKTKLQ